MLNIFNYDISFIMGVLHMCSGMRRIDFRFDLLNRYEAKIGELECHEARISYGENRAVMRSAVFEARASLWRSIDFLSDRVRPHFILHMPDGGTVEWPLGVFLLESPRYQMLGADKTLIIGAYDKTFILEQDRFTERFFISRGSRVDEIIKRILSTSGLTFVDIAQSEMEFAEDMEYQIGKKKRDAVNELLRMLNFTPIHADESGRLCAYNFTDPADRRVDLSYTSKRGGTVRPSLVESLDFAGRPNVFTRVALNIDGDELSSTYTNDNPLHPLSTVSRRRSIVNFAQVDHMPDQVSLDAMTKREAIELSNAGEILTFQTPLMPGHGCFKTLYLDIPEVLDSPAKFLETAWTMDLRFDGVMSHEARRITRL